MKYLDEVYTARVLLEILYKLKKTTDEKQIDKLYKLHTLIKNKQLKNRNTIP